MPTRSTTTARRRRPASVRTAIAYRIGALLPPTLHATANERRNILPAVEPDDPDDRGYRRMDLIGGKHCFRRRRFPSYFGQDQQPETADAVDGDPQWLSPTLKEFSSGSRFADCIFGPHLSYASFDGCTFEHCRFQSQIVTVMFRKCEFIACDFDLATLEDVGLKECKFIDNTFDRAVFLRCDLYRSDFQANNSFFAAVLGLVSITHTNIVGTSGLHYESFLPDKADRLLAVSRGAGHQDPLQIKNHKRAQMRRKVVLDRAHECKSFVQEDEKEYRALLYHIDDKTQGEAEALNKRLSEAGHAWRKLTGLWASTGAFDDSARAYRQSRELERRDAAPVRQQWVERTVPTGAGSTVNVTDTTRRRWNPPRRWLGLLIARWLCGFGSAWGRVIWWLLGLTVAFGVLFWAGEAVQLAHRAHGAVLSYVAASAPQAWLFSICQLTSSTPKGYSLTGSAWQMAASMETLMGIGLMGLFGFVLANNIRYS
jgi:hypothetical protein